jgi:hypothetical protein
MHRLSTRKGVNPPFRERTPPFAHLGTWMAARQAKMPRLSGSNVRVTCEVAVSSTPNFLRYATDSDDCGALARSRG